MQAYPDVAARDLGEFVDNLPASAVEICGNRRALRIQAKPGLTLPAGADSIVADEFPIEALKRDGTVLAMAN
jgi:hypothetical protein